jgi:hypothetical protein
VFLKADGAEKDRLCRLGKRRKVGRLVILGIEARKREMSGN